MELEQYIKDPNSSSSAGGDNWTNECRKLWDELPRLNQEHAALGKFATAAVGGFVLSRAWNGGGVAGVIVRGAGSAVGAIAVGEVMHPEHRTLRSYISDAAILTAGGICGAGLGGCRAAVAGPIIEWPGPVGAVGIEHRFGENIVYRSTARGAVLRMPNGSHYTWNEHRPIFRTDFERGVTTFSDGSELKILPGKQVQFKGVGASAADAKWDYKHDLSEDICVLETKSRNNVVQNRRYQLGHGTIVEQNPNGLLVSHSSGLMEELVTNPTTRGAMQNPYVTTMKSGARKFTFQNTNIDIAPDGSLRVQGIKKAEFHVPGS